MDDAEEKEKERKKNQPAIMPSCRSPSFFAFPKKRFFPLSKKKKKGHLLLFGNGLLMAMALFLSSFEVVYIYIYILLLSQNIISSSCIEDVLNNNATGH